ncbi:MAG: diguanylate cyclase, partial [Pseudomonadota bacterium]|nr:diguanylate cyclase [Pseudomonadota bacterium]
MRTPQQEAPAPATYDLRASPLALRGHSLFWQTALGGTMLSAVAAFALYQWEYQLAHVRERTEYEWAAKERIQALHDKLVHAVEQVHNLAAFYAASHVVTRQEFQVFATTLLAHEPSLQALEWIPLVPHGQRAFYEQAAQSDFPGFRITEQGPQGGMVTAAQRAAYFPVYFLEPYRGNEAALGFDMASEPMRLTALRQAWDSGRAAASGRITLVQEADGQSGILVFIPLHHAEISQAPGEQRRRPLRGFVLGSFRIGELVERALAPLEPKGIDLWLYDDSAPPDQRLLYQRLYPKPRLNPAVTGQPFAAGYRLREVIALAGRRWLVETAAAPGQFLPAVSATPWAVLVGGLLITGLISVYLTSLRAHAMNLAYQAHHDSLTGLPNRHLLQDRLQQTLYQAERHRMTMAVLLVDLDDFKAVNDSLGHQAGDRLLQAVAGRLTTCIRQGDTVARLGGDEFMLVLPLAAHQGEEHVTTVIERVLGRIGEPLTLSDQEVAVTCSIGISLYPRDGREAEVLLKNADAALYRAKESRNTFCFYQAQMNARALHRLSLQGSLRQAIERQELELHYQPQVALESGRIIGVEALVRWRHAQKGLIPPAEFIPLAEETGLI